MLQPIIFPVNGLRLSQRGTFHPISAMLPMPAQNLQITGVSRDSTGAALAGCICTLFRVVTNNSVVQFVQVAVTVSDGSGNFSFVVGTDGPYRVTFDLDGAPVRAGITLKTLAGV